MPNHRLSSTLTPFLAVFIFSLIIPAGFHFWLQTNPPQVNYLKTTILPADVLALVLFVFLLKNTSFIKSFVFTLPILLISLFHNHLFFYLRFLIYPPLFYWLFSNHYPLTQKVLKIIFYLLILTSGLLFLIANLTPLFSLPFKTYLSGHPLFLSSLPFTHPNTLAFVVLVIYTTTRLFTQNLNVLLSFFSLLTTGSFFSAITLTLTHLAFLPKSLLKKITTLLAGPTLIISTLLFSLDANNLFNRLTFLPVRSSVLELFFGHGPTQSITAPKTNPLFTPDPYWFFQPPHNTWLIIFYELGLLVFVWLAYLAVKLFFALKTQEKIVFLGFLFWSLFDHFFITTPTGQIFTSLLIAHFLFISQQPKPKTKIPNPKNSTPPSHTKGYNSPHHTP